MWNGPAQTTTGAAAAAGAASEVDVEMTDAAALELTALPEALKELSVSKMGGAAEVDETDLAEFQTSARNSPAPRPEPLQYAYEPAISMRMVPRQHAHLLTRGVSAIEEQVIYEESDANVTRRQTFSRTLRPASFWDKHQHFRLWAQALFYALMLLVGVGVAWNVWRDVRQSLAVSLLEASHDGYYKSQYAQKMWEQNLCDLGPPVDLIDRCVELDRLRSKDYEAVPAVVGLGRMVRSLAQTLFHDLNWKVAVLIPLACLPALLLLRRF